MDSHDGGAWACVGCGIGAVVQRCRSKCPPDSAGGGGEGRRGINPPSPPEWLRQRAAGAFKRSWSCLGNTAETRRNRRAVRTVSSRKASTGRSARNTRVWLTLSLWKGFRKFPPISPSSLGVPGWLFMLRLPGEFWGKECKGHPTPQIYKFQLSRFSWPWGGYPCLRTLRYRKDVILCAFLLK